MGPDSLSLLFLIFFLGLLLHFMNFLLFASFPVLRSPASACDKGRAWRSEKQHFPTANLWCTVTHTQNQMSESISQIRNASLLSSVAKISYSHHDKKKRKETRKIYKILCFGISSRKGARQVGGHLNFKWPRNALTSGSMAHWM